MPDINLCNVKTEDLSGLLAANLMDVQNGALTSTAGEDKIRPYTNNRTILIGLGGTGLKTLNHVKRVLNQKMSPEWIRYIAFLAIDSDNNEFENAAYLTREEFVCTTRDGITEAVNKSSYPKAWLPFVEPEKARELEAYSGNGAGRKRLMGKMKLHYAKSGDTGVDEDIVAKLGSIKADVLDSIADGEHYEVYVIGSLSGGTCSGSFLEMPALIRRALNVAVDKVSINAMLYLPDTVIALDEKNKTELMANGYASLKELNYFQGLYMRENTTEEFPYNGEKLKLNHNQGLYNMPYLIGTVAGPMKTSDKIARDTIAEFFISILGNMVPDVEDEEGVFLMDSFFNNAMNRLGTRPIDETYDPREVESAGSAHEFPKRYGTVGFAQASAPQRIIHSYTIGKACVAAGLQPVSDETRKNMAADGAKFLPFLGEYQLETAQVVNQQRMELLKSLMGYMSTYQAQTFKFEAANGAAPEYKEVLDGTAEANVAGSRKNIYTSATSIQAKNAMEDKVKEQFRLFRTAVKTFVSKNGPMAFYNLYNGYAHQVQGQQPAKGIREYLQLLVDNQDPASGNPMTWPSAKVFAQQAQEVKNQLNGKGGGLFGLIGEALSGKRKELAGQWVQKYDLMVNAEINEKRREYMLGRNGILDTCFAQPAQRLAQQLYVFGKILEVMTEGYNSSGSKLGDYQSFAGVGDNATEVNIAALDPNAHAWVQSQAQESANNVDREKVRNALVDSFFEDPNGWLTVAGELVKPNGENYKLVSEEIPVNARHKFDQVLKENVKLGEAVTVSVLFKNIRNVDPSDYARRIVKELFKKSRPLFNGSLDSKSLHCYVMYPRSLKTDSPDVVKAIENEAKQLNPSVGFYGTDYADSIMMYQLVAPFEVYHLKDLPAWEYEYERRHDKLGNGLHGMSPDVKQGKSDTGAIIYTEKTPWYDYPAIVYRKNPKGRDSDGNICHEGKVRLEMDKVIEEARELGLLYCKKLDKKQYMVYAICMDASIDWKLDDITMLPKKGNLYPEGLDLLEAMAEDNRSSLADLTRPVKLAQAGLMSMTHVDEKWAWEYASRVLYAHRSLFNMIRDTIDKVKPWNDMAVEENEKLRAKLKPAKMIRMMQSKVYYEAPDQRWLLEDENGRPAAVFSMAKQALDRMRLRDPKSLKLINNGFTLYYAYTKLLEGEVNLNALAKVAEQKMADDDLIDELEVHAGKVLDLLDDQVAKLRSLGAKLDDEDELEDQKRLIANMADLGINDPKKVVDMCRFYYFAQFWGDV